VLTNNPEVCHKGYEPTDRRPPQNTGWRDMVTSVRCAEPPTQSNARGAQNLPRPAAYYDAIVQEPGVERWELLLLTPFAAPR
jgi:phospholipid/cholesterol/gamma-HCH transport system substrate-binding protein